MKPLKQTDQPLFADILWSRPVTRTQAGKLLIIGGNTSNFSQTQAAYEVAKAAGIGECRVVLPEGLKPMLQGIEDCIFLSQNPSGSLAASSYDELAALAKDSDGILLAGEVGRNEETTSLLERLVANTSLPLVAGEDTMAQLGYEPSLLSQRPQTLLVANYQFLQDWVAPLKLPIAFTSQLNWPDLLNKLDTLATEHARAHWLISREEWLHLVCERRISSTQAKAQDPAALAALAAVFWIQNTDKPFEAITTAAYVYAQSADSRQTETLDKLKHLLAKFE